MDTFIYIEQGTKVELKFTQIIQILYRYKCECELETKIENM